MPRIFQWHETESDAPTRSSTPRSPSRPFSLFQSPDSQTITTMEAYVDSISLTGTIGSFMVVSLIIITDNKGSNFNFSLFAAVLLLCGSIYCLEPIRSSSRLSPLRRFSLFQSPQTITTMEAYVNSILLTGTMGSFMVVSLITTTDNKGFDFSSRRYVLLFFLSVIIRFLESTRSSIRRSPSRRFSPSQSPDSQIITSMVDYVFNILPTWTIGGFTLLIVIFSTDNEGCDSFSRRFRQLLLFLFAIPSFLASFTDSVNSTDGQVYYGFATFKNIYLFNYPDTKAASDLPDLRKYRIRSIDPVHAVLSLTVFLAVAVIISFGNVFSCFYLTPLQLLGTKHVLAVIGFICTLLLVVFPTRRHGIRFTLGHQILVLGCLIVCLFVFFVFPFYFFLQWIKPAKRNK